MTKRTIDVEVSLSVDEVLESIKSFGPLDSIRAIKIIAENMTDDEIKMLKDYACYTEIVKIVTEFLTRITR